MDSLTDLVIRPSAVAYLRHNTARMLGGGAVATFYLGWVSLSLAMHPERAPIAAAVAAGLVVVAVAWVAIYRIHAKIEVGGNRLTQVGLFRTQSYPVRAIASL